MILACPLAIWIVRRVLFRVLRGNPVWGVERPALETWAAAVAFAPIVAWLGNPLWWREALPRLAHYLMLNTARHGVVPEIPIYYFGQTYFYSLPWHNSWVLMAITVPAGILMAALAGSVYALWNARRDLVPVYFVVHLVTLPAIRMVGTPATRWRPAFPADLLLPGRDGGVGDGLGSRRASPPDAASQPDVALGRCNSGARPGGLAAREDPSLRAVLLQ